MKKMLIIMWICVQLFTIASAYDKAQLEKMFAYVTVENSAEVAAIADRKYEEGMISLLIEGAPGMYKIDTGAWQKADNVDKQFWIFLCLLHNYEMTGTKTVFVYVGMECVAMISNGTIFMTTVEYD